MQDSEEKNKAKKTPSSESVHIQRDSSISIEGDNIGPVVTGDHNVIQIGTQITDIESLSPKIGAPPYKGLAGFDEADSALYFGRSALISSIVDHLHQSDFLAVYGPSGSGKSSLVRAGVISAIKGKRPLPEGQVPPSGHWKTITLNPTARPVSKLVQSVFVGQQNRHINLESELKDGQQTLADLWMVKSQNAAEQYLLVVDQFEELITLCESEAERQSFIDSLLSGVGSCYKLILVFRSDFIGDLTKYRGLHSLLNRNQELIPMMSSGELAEVINLPAEQNGWRIQEGLSDQIIRDLGDEPGRLPLLSHALFETWANRRDVTLTLSGYREAGGVDGAIAQTADRVLSTLSEEEYDIARKLFLELVTYYKNVRVTRKAIPRNMFEDSHGMSERVIEALAKARLIITDHDSINLSHEALIREWDTFETWYKESRDFQFTLNELRKAIVQWIEAGKDEAYLYSGSKLDTIVTAEEKFREWMHQSAQKI